eukprot:2130827-Pyramimonas_sp.AAC.1
MSRKSAHSFIWWCGAGDAARGAARERQREGGVGVLGRAVLRAAGRAPPRAPPAGVRHPPAERGAVPARPKGRARGGRAALEGAGEGPADCGAAPRRARGRQAEVGEREERR